MCIEVIRRHAAPNFIKQFQIELLHTLFDCRDSAEVLIKGESTLKKRSTNKLQILKGLGPPMTRDEKSIHYTTLVSEVSFFIILIGPC